METAKYVLEAKGISRTYKGEVPVYALKETDLAFTEGEFVAIVGHSGKLLIKKPENGSAIELVIPRFDLKKSIETE